MNAPALSIDRLEDLIKKARALGADAADALRLESRHLYLTHRLGQREELERSETFDLGLRAFVGKRQAIVSSSDLSDDALVELAERAVAMARAAPEDPFCGLAEPDQLAGGDPDLDMFDDAEPDAEALAALAAEAEDAARAIPGVTNSEGANASWGVSGVLMCASNGFARSYRRSRHGLSCAVLAGEGVGMERDYDSASAVHGVDLLDAAAIGREAGERAVRRLNPRKVESAQVPVVFDPRVSKSLLGHLSSAINGASVSRGTSFLKDAMGERIMPRGVNVIDDPHRRRGLRSRAFDAEGLPTTRMDVVRDGVLATWILDLGSARQLGLDSTGSASRGLSGPPSPSASNLYLEPGDASPDALMGDIKQGLYVTEMIGFGVNGVTGDYSRGATGFWIENGEIAHPVSEVTIAGNLKDMFANMTQADDLEFRYGVNAPTIRVDGMTIAGQ